MKVSDEALPLVVVGLWLEGEQWRVGAATEGEKHLLDFFEYARSKAMDVDMANPHQPTVVHPKLVDAAEVIGCVSDYDAL